MSKAYIFCLTIIIFITGCSSKEDLYNRPAMFWYKKMIKEIKDYDLEDADNYYLSLASEHVNSPILKEATKIMALAHMDDESYKLSDYYFDEYMKMFGNKTEVQEARFFKLKAKYYGILKLKRDQLLIRNTIKEAKEFKDRYPNSKYKYYVDSIIVVLEAARYDLLKDIAKLHKKLGNKESYEIYQSKIKESFIHENINTISPHNNFFIDLFE